MPRGRPVEPETRAAILADIRGGEMSRNAIARKHSVAGAVVTNIAADAGLTFDRTKTQLAVAAHLVDLEKLRTDLVNAAMVEAFAVLDDMRSPTVYSTFEPGGTKTRYNEDGKIIATEPVSGEWRDHLAEEPSISDKRNLATIFGILTQRSADLLKLSSASSSRDTESFVAGLADTLRTVADVISADPTTDPTIAPTHVDRETLLAEYMAGSEGLPDDDDASGN